jgi:hypothetical protein
MALGSMLFSLPLDVKMQNPTAALLTAVGFSKSVGDRAKTRLPRSLAAERR